MNQYPKSDLAIQLASLRSTILDKFDDDELQLHLLQGVSRTFALTIPLLPSPLQAITTNAYLLCRTIDTIEDDPVLDFNEKEKQCHRFLKVLKNELNPTEFSIELLALISKNTRQKELELIAYCDRIVSYTLRLPNQVKQAIIRCVQIMSEGMIHFQRNAAQGILNQNELDRYCYVVAGVVGEMLTVLFCFQSTETALNQQKLESYSISFGQGLQMTNILKDIWEDLDQGICWLPRDLIQKEKMDVNTLKLEPDNPVYQTALSNLIGITHQHLQDAFAYTLAIAPKDKGIRSFCLVALGLAILTLRKINANRFYQNAVEVKVSRKAVKYVLLGTRQFASNNFILKLIFRQITKGLPLRKRTEIA